MASEAQYSPYNEPVQETPGNPEPGSPETSGTLGVPEKSRRSPLLSILFNLVFGLLLILAFAAGVYFRFVGQNWDDFTHLHPDERFLTQVAESISGSLRPTDQGETAQAEHLNTCLQRYPGTNGVGTFFDTLCSTWYPPNVGYGLYVYGELPLFVVRIAAETAQEFGIIQVRMNACQSLENPPSFFDCLSLIQSNDLSQPRVKEIVAKLDQNALLLANSWTGYSGIHLVGRSVSAVAELLSLVFVFLIGRRLFNKWVGLLAVMLASAAVFPIQLAHFWTADAFTNLPVTMTFYFAVRAMDRGKPIDFALAGVGLGAAMASRINTLPLVGVIGLAGIIYGLPVLSKGLPKLERSHLLSRAVGGIAIAGVATFLVFRVASPHAFVGGPGLFGILDVRPYKPFLDNIAAAQYQTSGNYDSPPNHQWASRPAYLFPARNIVLWGLGLPLGLMAILGTIWATWQILRARPGWTRHALLVAWILVYFGYMGRQWVMTMRYYMPLYPFLILMAAWALAEIATRAWRWMHRNPRQVRRLAFGTSAALLLFVVGFTYLWATMYTSVYRRQLTRVEASNWVMRTAPSAVSATLTAPQGETRLVNISLYSASLPGASVTLYKSGERNIVPFSALNGSIDRVQVNHLTDPDRAGKQKTFWVGISANQDAVQLLATGSVTDDFGKGASALGDSYTIMLDKPLAVGTGRTYYLATWADGRVAVSRSGDSLAEFSLLNGPGTKLLDVKLPDQAVGQSSFVVSSTPAQFRLTAPLTGSIDRINLAHLLNTLQDNRNTTINISLSDSTNATVLARGTISVNANSTQRSPFGDPYTIKLDTPVTVTTDQSYYIAVSTADGGAAQITGTAIATEGPWDDPVPEKVCDLPADMELSDHIPPGMSNAVTCQGVDPWGPYYRGLELYMAAEDDWQKQEIMQTVLDQADYITMSSNRFYDSLSRLPMRFPMSIKFYDALFSGQLGFELVNLTTSSYALGDLKISDQYLPTYTGPKWLNEWESEEAFSVYDHPAVLIFKKNPDLYSSQYTAQVLHSIPLNDASAVSLRVEDSTPISIIRWGALPASTAPTGLLMDKDLRDIQTQGGTWSDLFNREWLINAQPVLAVIFWWLIIMLIGLAVWPILYLLLPALPDRGYPMAKIAGLLIVAWLAWAGGSLRLLTWSQAGLALIILALAALSAVISWRKRAELREYVRLNWRHFVIVELITLALFVAFLFVRLGNPDLWAQSLGGEKPMNFAYFNAVLRSTVFPPYDPWYAGGFLNYYYWGYVLVGSPVKLIGLMPSIAYNLIIPTLFALTGIGAFSLAFNITASRWFYPRAEGQSEKTAPFMERRRFALRTPQGRPYVAGMMALLLCVVVGNLGTPAVFLSGVARAGTCSSDAGSFSNWKLNDFVNRMGRQPTPAESADLTQAINEPSLGDQIGYGLYTLRQPIECLARGLKQVFDSPYLDVSPDRWFWAPRSVVGELPGSSSEINEFPYFTFVFGDLHAHMMSMPLQLLAIGWLLAEILAAGYIRRHTWTVIAATAFGGLCIGMLLPTNSWDWPTYLVLGLVGLVFAIFLRRQRFNLHNLVNWAGQVIWLYAAQAIALIPFSAFFATAYASLKSFQGNKTPIWAYFTMHGIFLFVVGSLLIWQTARLLRQSYVRDFIGRTWPLRLIVWALGATALIALFLAVVRGQLFLINAPIPLSLVLLPLIAWCVVLFLIPGQSREWQIMYAMIGLALCISFGVEIVVLGGDIGRQNTFFKFYMQIWLLFSVACGVGLAWLFHESQHWRATLRGGWLVCIAILLCIGGLFPIMSTEGKIAVRMAPDAPHTLDGDAYMESAIYYEGPDAVPLKNDLKIIHWLQDNVKGTPVILEAHQYPSEYKMDGRISINTGLPTVLGWRWHEQQQRTLDPLPNLVTQRESNIAALYNTTDISTAWQLLKFFNVEYIIAARLEQITYTPEGLAKFDTMVQRKLLEVVYSANGDKIYRMVPGATLDNLIVGWRHIFPTDS